MGISVSRVGGNAQVKAMRQVAGSLRLDLAQYRALAAFAQFGSDLDKASQQQLTRGSRLTELLKQAQFAPMAAERQIVAIFSGVNGFLDDMPLDQIRAFEAGLLNYFDNAHPQLLTEIREKRELSDDLRKRVSAAVQEFKTRFIAEHKK